MANILQIIFRTRKEGNAPGEIARETDQLTVSAQKATEALQRHSAAVEANSREMHSSVEASRAATEGAEKLASGVSQLGSGNVIGGVRSLTSGIKNLWQALVANPIGLVVTGISAAVAGFIRWRQTVAEAAEEARAAHKRFEDFSQGLHQTRNSIDASANRIADALHRVAQAGLSMASTGGWEGITEQLRAAADDASRLRAEAEALADADLADRMAQIDLEEASGAITGPEASRRRQSARVEAASRKREAQRFELEEQANIAREAETQASNIADEAADRASRARATALAQQSDIDASGVASRPREAVEAELAALAKNIGTINSFIRRGATGRAREELETRRGQLEGRKAEIERGLAIVDSDAQAKTQQELAAAEAELARATAALAEARRKRAKADRALEFQGALLNRAGVIAATETQTVAVRTAHQELEARLRVEELAARDREASAERARREQDRAEAERAKAAAQAVAQQAAVVAGFEPILPGQVTSADVPGLSSTAKVRSRQGEINQAAAALNTFRQQAASDRVITPEEVDALYALIGEFVAVAQSMGNSQKGALSQVDRLRRELDLLREKQQNLP